MNSISGRNLHAGSTPEVIKCDGINLGNDTVDAPIGACDRMVGERIAEAYSHANYCCGCAWIRNRLL